MKFKKIQQRPSFPALEAKVLERWKAEKTFEASVEKNKSSGEEFIFYDGPPFPTGNPHHGTIFVSILKDIIPRYKTMRGYYVPRGWGWDCHGLPIETLAEKNLGIKEKTEIESSLGVKAFNAECRKIVSEFNESWKAYIDKLGRWVDFDDPYQTLDRDFMESVIWSFAESYKKGLIYKDYRVNPYCYRCETPLSISDTRLDDATRPKQDPSVTVRMAVKGEENLYFLVWTTTPWTLPSNLAVAVGEGLTYVKINKDADNYILAKDLLPKFAKEFGKKPKILAEFSGSDLVAKNYSYEPIFPYFKDQNPNGFKVIIGDFVTTDEGTGLVHMAPAFGEDDYWLCRKNNISVIAPLDEKGCFTEEVTDFAGKNVHDVNRDIIKFLKNQGDVIQDRTIEHNYPHCWRCRTPLIYKALDAWYFSIEKIKEKLIENNQKISWYPETVKEGRFGNWLKNARDWNISRNRYWATPIPVWDCSDADCGNREVLGSVEELEAKAGKELPDIHKEFLDEISYPCSKCDGTMNRVPEVLDGWYESGSMPYGQFHYPFKNAEHFRSHFPADFIVEYTGQIRGWFYYLHVLSTALFDKPAFKHCLVHGTLLAEDGKKISKSLKNYTDPMELMDKYGADALRAYLLSANAVQMADLAFRDDGVEGMVKNISLPLWNALSFFTTYAETDEISVDDLNLDSYLDDLTELDRYILSEQEILLSTVTEKLDSYAIHEATKLLSPFLDTLTNWYIRRSRQRVWIEDTKDKSKLCFYAALYRVLSRFTQMLSPFCPFLTETVWENLGNSESIHLSNWPEVNESLIDNNLSEEIALSRRIISAGLSARAKEKIRVRQPLQSLKLVISGSVSIEGQLNAVKDELNVKKVVILEDESEIAERVGKPNAALIGPKFGKDVQKIIQALKAGDFEEHEDGSATAAGIKLDPEMVEIAYIGKEGLAVESTAGAVLSLDTELTPELIKEGQARDIVRFVQELRKEADLHVSDRIELQITGAEEVLSDHKDYICKETLAVSLVDSLSNPKASQKVRVEGAEVEIALQVAA